MLLTYVDRRNASANGLVIHCDGQVADVQDPQFLIESQSMGFFGQNIVGDGRTARTTDAPVVVAERVDKQRIRIRPSPVAAHVHRIVAVSDIHERDRGLGSNNHEDPAHQLAIGVIGVLLIGLDGRLATKTTDLYRGACLHIRPLVAVENVRAEQVTTAEIDRSASEGFRSGIVGEMGRTALGPR